METASVFKTVEVTRCYDPGDCNLNLIVLCVILIIYYLLLLKDHNFSGKHFEIENQRVFQLNNFQSFK